MQLSSIRPTRGALLAALSTLVFGAGAPATPAAAQTYGAPVESGHVASGAGCCCDDGRYQSFGLGAAGSRGGLGLGGGPGSGLGGIGGGYGGGGYGPVGLGPADGLGAGYDAGGGYGYGIGGPVAYGRRGAPGRRFIPGVAGRGETGYGGRGVLPRRYVLR